jgi:hypothetical protein
MSHVNSTSYPAEMKVISKRLQDRGVETNLRNIKRYLISAS